MQKIPLVPTLEDILSDVKFADLETPDFEDWTRQLKEANQQVIEAVRTERKKNHAAKREAYRTIQELKAHLEALVEETESNEAKVRKQRERLAQIEDDVAQIRKDLHQYDQDVVTELEKCLIEANRCGRGLIDNLAAAQ